MSENFSDIVKNYSIAIESIGFSAVDKREIKAARITRRVDCLTELNPMFKFVANIHGDDTVGYAFMVSLIQNLVYSDAVDDRITRLLDTIDIWSVPTLKTDGLYCLLELGTGRCNDVKANSGKYNKRGVVELYQNFLHFVPDMDWLLETRSKLCLLQIYPFVLSAHILHPSCSNYLPASDLPKHWHANVESMYRKRMAVGISTTLDQVLFS